MYKINIHSHTIFSDGFNTPITMAYKAKELGFTALVVTDHFYGKVSPEFMSKNNLRLLRKACDEARKILPVIIGMEVPFMEQEILVFGGAAIKWIIENDLPTKDDIIRLKKETGCAIILCHPGKDFEDLIDVIDGFEMYNSGFNYFKNRTAELDSLKGKQRWCNSDAHKSEWLDIGYNIVDSKIKTEHDLIKYIKRGKQHDFYVKEMENENE